MDAALPGGEKELELLVCTPPSPAPLWWQGPPIAPSQLEKLVKIKQILHRHLTKAWDAGL